MELTIIKVFLPTALAFFIGLIITPVITRYLYKHQAWKKTSGKGQDTPLFNRLHSGTDTNTPRMGGIVVWASVFLTIFSVAALEWLLPGSALGDLNFLSRAQTWLPLMALGVGAIVGLADDWLTVTGNGRRLSGGLPLSQRMLVVGTTAVFSAWWFYEKLEVSSVQVIGFGEWQLGLWFIPFFVFVALCVYMSTVIDGIDGLSGGVFMFIFAAYAGIALYQNQIDMAAFCATVVGGILAFLWFNIPPARFHIGETGMMALTMSLTVIAFMTDVLGEGEGVSVLPIIGGLLALTVVTNTIQIISKRFFGRKVFLIAPIHHHFEALGWPSYKVTMRYWVLGFIFAVIGILFAIGF